MEKSLTHDSDIAISLHGLGDSLVDFNEACHMIIDSQNNSDQRYRETTDPAQIALQLPPKNYTKT